MTPKIHPSITRVNARLAQIRALFPPTTFLIFPIADDRNGEIYGDDDQPLQSPPFELDAPDEIEMTDTLSTPAGIEFVEAVSLAEIVNRADDAESLALNIEADEVERDHQRAEIARMEAEQEDAYHCGQSCDYSAEIEAAQEKIKVINQRLETPDVLAEIAAVARPECPYERAGIAVAEREAKRLSLPFWRYYDARQAETRDYERDCIRHRIADGRAQRRTNQYQREVPCTSGQVKYIEFLAGGATEGRALVDRALTELRVSEATALIEWLKNGRPNA